MIINPKEAAQFAVNAFGALQKPEEFAELLELLEDLEPKIILEIGIGNGGSSWAFSKLESVELIVGIDLPGGPFGGGPEMNAMQYIGNNMTGKYTYVQGDSKSPEVSKFVHELLGADGVDFLFIDGDHSFEGVKADYTLYSGLVKPGGLVAFHDICEHPPETGCEVKKFWDSLVKEEDKFGEFIKEPTNWGGIGWIRK